MLRARGIYETVLYTGDLDAAERFYHDVIGLAVSHRNDLFITFPCGSGVLLVFDRNQSNQPGRSVPAHGTEGAGHIAFAVRPEELDSWREHLRNRSIEIEEEVEWKSGERSIYLRDPAGNSVELAPPTLWNV